jgi:ubiquitin-protein ligase
MSSIHLRLTSEYKALMQDMPEGIINIDLIDSITTWRSVLLQQLLLIPQLLGYKCDALKQVLILIISFSDDYPYEAPTVKFVNQIYHPNVGLKTGTISILHPSYIIIIIITIARYTML